MSITVSVVVPTRNRTNSLNRTLASLESQSIPPSEIVVVDSSDVPLSHADLPTLSVPVELKHCYPSVCRQRNLGIAAAQGDFILLLDDDIELSNRYLQCLLEYAQRHSVNAVSGLVLQQEGEQWVYQYPPSSFRRLLFCWIFQLSIWGEIESIGVPRWARVFFDHIRNFYQRRNNTVTLAGWPLITDFGGEAFATAVYGLGASLVEKSLVVDAFDETLDPHGIGDNYGVVTAFATPIQVVKSVYARHYRSEDNRLPPSITHFRRLLALHYFLIQNSTWSCRLVFFWSLFGTFLATTFANQGLAWPTLKVMYLVTIGRNPYVIARNRGQKNVAPVP